MTPRPKISDLEVVAAAAKLLAPKVLAWAGDESTPDDLPEIEADLARAIAKNDDGYSIALSLDLDGYEPNAALVAILDEASWALHEAQKAAEIEWIKTSGLAAPEIDSRVVWRKCPDAVTGGVVLALDGPSGKALVRFASDRNTLAAIPWEDLQPEEAK